MKNMIYKSSGKFSDRFATAVINHADKLTFNTRDEYLIWVKQWKEDYKLILPLVRIEKLNRLLYSGSTPLPATVERVERQIEQIKNSVDFNTAMGRALVLQQQIAREYNINFYGRCSMYTIIVYLMVIRKAGKIRAGKKREERIAAQNVTAA